MRRKSRFRYVIEPYRVPVLASDAGPSVKYSLQLRPYCPNTSCVIPLCVTAYSREEVVLMAVAKGIDVDDIEPAWLTDENLSGKFSRGGVDV